MSTDAKNPPQSTQAPCSALRSVAAIMGVERLDCRTCLHGAQDWDGEPGATFYCGTVCGKHDLPGTYVEDNGLDVDAEKACWEPDFWKTEIPEVEGLIDGTDEGMDHAFERWKQIRNKAFASMQNATSEPRRGGDHATGGQTRGAGSTE